MESSASPISSILSASQVEKLREAGEEREAAVGDVLFRVGDRRYPLIVILDGEVAIEDASGAEVVRHSVASGFLGEMNLLTGQTVYLTARVTKPLRYIAVERERLRELIADDASLADVILSALIRRREALQESGVGVEVIGPRDSAATRDTTAFLTKIKVPHSWRDPESDPEIEELIAATPSEELPVVRLPGGEELRAPSDGVLSRTLGIGLELGSREEVDMVVVGAGPAGLGASVYGASEGLSTLAVERSALGGQAGTSRRIENYLGFPAGISGTELTSRAVTQARKFGARTATPYRATRLEPGEDLHLVHLEEGNVVAARSVVLATGADYRRLPVEGLSDYEGISVFYAAGPPEAQRCGNTPVAVVGGGNSAAQAAIWLARGGARVVLLHRRADLGETMSHYLVSDLAKYEVEVRNRSEIAELHGAGGELEGVTLKDGAKLPVRFLFLFLGAVPCTSWLPDEIARDDDGFILTGAEAGAEGLLETSVPGIFAAGDVRAGSIKRCATAVGEGATVVRFVHERLNQVPA